MNNKEYDKYIEELREQAENARKSFEEHPSIRTGSRYGDAMKKLEDAMKTR